MDALGALLPFVLIIGIFYLLLIRPQQKRAKEQREMQRAIGVGDDIMLTSGIFGEVVDVTDEKVDVEIAPGTVITVIRGAVGTKVPASVAGSAGDDADHTPYDTYDGDGSDSSYPADSDPEPGARGDER